jgi:hypothetical protein
MPRTNSSLVRGKEAGLGLDFTMLDSGHAAQQSL